MRPCVTVDSATSIRVAIEHMREAGQEFIPVTEGTRLVGIVDQSGILNFLKDSDDESRAVTQFMSPAATISNQATVEAALHELHLHPWLVVIDDHDFPCGIITAASFVGLRPRIERPGLVGGMATPFGVYLTSGIVGGGKSGWYLVTTGMFMGTMMIVGNLFGNAIGPRLPQTAWAESLYSVLIFFPLILAFKLLPISGYHAAEHQVVHAIERGEPLTVEAVKRMPRVHPRCGTNIAVAVTMLTGISQTHWIADEGLRNFLAVFATLFMWRSVGGWVQFWITTKKATDKQIQSAIDAAKELMQNYQVAPRRTASFGTRILSSGILHVMFGSILTLGTGCLIDYIFKLKILLD